MLLAVSRASPGSLRHMPMREVIDLLRADEEAGPYGLSLLPCDFKHALEYVGSLKQVAHGRNDDGRRTARECELPEVQAPAHVTSKKVQQCPQVRARGETSPCGSVQRLRFSQQTALIC